jgi:maltooligosyltrehalose trehalohydrolase
MPSSASASPRPSLCRSPGRPGPAFDAGEASGSLQPHLSDRAPKGPLGAYRQTDGRCDFLLWAPRARRVVVRLSGREPRSAALEPLDLGYHFGSVAGIAAGDRYAFSLDGGPERPDPASRHQPSGVHGTSAVVDPAFPWNDGAWRGVGLEDLVFYELHVGTFTPQGTFEAILPHLPELSDLGITALELMPVAQFPGERNWGYDGVDLFAVQDSYGGPPALKRLVDACHAAGLAAFLDVVYNHLGPEGNYLSEFGPYFTDRYRTPWGDAVNFDGPGSDEVRRFFLENARSWIQEFHFDGLRLDAVHAICDDSARPFLAELAQAVHREGERRGWPAYVVAESDRNDARLIRPTEQGGLGLDAVWSDDFHHALHALETGEHDGYYQDFGSPTDLATAFSRAFVYVGQRSTYRGRSHGSSPAGLDPSRFVVCAQNHDQIGNRMGGERLVSLVGVERDKVASAAVLLSPFLPLLFMGEEYGESAPFLYFVSHGDPGLIESVREGRRREFASFSSQGEPPDPQSRQTFERSRIDLRLAARGRHRPIFEFHRELLRLRREVPALRGGTIEAAVVEDAPGLVSVLRTAGQASAWLLLAFEDGPTRTSVPSGTWLRALDSGDERWGGSGGGPPESLGKDRSLHFLGPRALLWLSGT